MEDLDLRGDPMYKVFRNNVERALKAFEASTGWPDLIAAINKLKKALEGNQKFSVIPMKTIIGKRLAQCMHPSLPGGVHQTAISCYHTIFTTIGTNRLAQDLDIFGKGLFPLLENAQVAIRKELLTIYETHFVPLGSRLRPCLTGFLSGILLGFEEDPQSEYMKRVFALLNAVCEATQKEIFFSCLWQCVLTNQAVRQSAFTYALERYNSSESITNQLFVLGIEHSVVIQGLCQSVQSQNNIYVQRLSLDFLFKVFPMHIEHKNIQDEDRIQLMTACLPVIRMDPSLEKRFYKWILHGPDEFLEQDIVPHTEYNRSLSMASSESDHVSSWYFDHWSKHIFIQAFRRVLSNSVSLQDFPDLRPYKLLTKLLEKPELQKVIKEDLFIDVLRTLYHGHASFVAKSKIGSSSSSPKVADLIMQAIILFDDLQSKFIWDFCGRQFEKNSCRTYRINDSDDPVNGVGSPETTVIEMCALIRFLIDIVPGSINKHLPDLYQTILKVLANRCAHLSAAELSFSLNLVEKMLSELEMTFRTWDEKTNQTNSDPNDLARLRSDTTFETSSTDSENSTSETRQEFSKILEDCCHCFKKFLVEFYRLRVFSDELGKPNVILKQMLLKFFQTSEDRTRHLVNLLESTTENQEDLSEPEDFGVVEKFSRYKAPMRDGIFRLGGAFQSVCNIITKLFIPKFVEHLEDLRSEPTSPRLAQKIGSKSLDVPEWFEYLLLSSSILGSDHADLMLTSISALFSMAEHIFAPTIITSDNINIVLCPLLEKSHFIQICQRTVVFQVLAAKLWEGLEQMSPVHHQKCVQLLYQINSIIPGGMGIEQIISRSLTSRDAISEDGRVVGAFQRLTLFWHLSRDVITNFMVTKPKIKTFDICLKLMLDNLSLPSGPLKTLTETWLVHSLTRGDLARILEPLLLTLLDPGTARVSVLHCKVEACDTTDDTTNNNEPSQNRVQKVYTIVTETGETFHHIAKGTNHQLNGSQTSILGLLTPYKRTSQQMISYKIKESSPEGPLKFIKKLYKKKGEPQEEIPKPAEFDLANMPIQVNPFSLVPPETKDFDLYTSGYGNRSPRPKSRSSGNISGSTSTSSSIYESPPTSLHTFTTDDNGKNEELDLDQIHELVASILDDVIDISLMEANHGRTFFESDETFGNNSQGLNLGLTPSPRNPMVLHLHSHVLLYTQVSDSTQLMFAMRCIKNILQTNPRHTLGMLTTTNLSSAQAPRKSQIQMLLARHRKSVFGKGFAGDLPSEFMATFRNTSLFEVLLANLLYYLRSYYPNLGHDQVESEIRGNREVQLMSINIIIALVSELSLMVRDNGRAFATFIFDIFTRCKVHKVVLHSLLACVNDMRRLKNDPGFTDDILNFNEVHADGHETNTSQKISNYSEAFQIELLRLLLTLVMLEQIVWQQKGESREKGGEHVRPASDQVVPYYPERVIPDQQMFLVAISTALRQPKIRHLHSHWTSLVVSCLPFLGRSLSVTALETVALLCQNLERLSVIYSNDDEEQISELGTIPADYMITQLEALTIVYHYCVLDSYSQVNMTFPTPVVNQATNMVPSSGSGEILNNLRHVFLSSFDPKQLVTSFPGSSDTLALARKNLLAKLPRLVSCCVILWMEIEQSSSLKNDATCLLVGDPKVIRTRLLDFLSPIGHHHPNQFISAIALTWQNSKKGSPHTTLPTCNTEQQVTVDMVSAMKSMPVATLIQTVKLVLKSPPVLDGVGSSEATVSVLEFFYFYLAKCNARQVFLSWSNLSSLLRHCLNLSPPAVFMAVSILCQFVHRSQLLPSITSESQENPVNQSDGVGPGTLDRKDQKELQELAGKLIDTCATIAGSYLEQTTWLRRNYVVNVDLQIANAEGAEQDGKKSLHHYAVPALSLLGEVLAPLLDIIYQSEEKEKVVPLLSNLFQVVMPYLKNHTRANIASFQASSRLLASLSEYKYTRKAWKKDGFDFLLDQSFFQMDLASLRHWEMIIDNLMTQDKKTMDELINKVSTISVGLFATREQEFEQRALLLKRLAFVIFSSDLDQYENIMPAIQEIVAISLRNHNTYLSVQCSVFLCFRVILMRMSPTSVAYLWPLIITEMVVVLKDLEMELSKTIEKCNEFLQTVDRADCVEELASRNNPSGMMVFLSVCKLLDLCLAMPAQLLPQFQMYKWEFVSPGNEIASSPESNGPQSLTNGTSTDHFQDFVPYIVRLAKKFPHVKPVEFSPGEPLLTMKFIRRLDDLAPFFATISHGINHQPSSWSEHSESQFNAVLEQDFQETFTS